MYFFVAWKKTQEILKSGQNMLWPEVIDSQLVQIYTKADLTMLSFIF